MPAIFFNLARNCSALIISLFLVFFYALDHQSVFANNTEDLKAIVKAWENRENKIHSFNIIWSSKTFIKKPKVRSKLDSPTEPLEDRFFETKEGVFVDSKGRIRLDYLGQTWSDEKKAYTQNQHHNVFDSKTNQIYFPQGALSHPSAHINKGDPVSIINIIPLVPVRAIFRPFDKNIGVFDRTGLVLTDDKEIVNGSLCLVLKSPIYHISDDGKYQRKVWVDPNMDYVPVKICDSMKGLPVVQTEVSFVKVDRYNWIPKSWNISTLDLNGLVDTSFSGTVTDYKINEDFPDSTFQLDYQVGTFVFNAINNENYIVLENNEKRIVKPGEYNGKNYEQLKSGKTVSDSGSR
jgi:hypothetical protein